MCVVNSRTSVLPARAREAAPESTAAPIKKSAGVENGDMREPPLSLVKRADSDQPDQSRRGTIASPSRLAKPVFDESLLKVKRARHGCGTRRLNGETKACAIVIRPTTTARMMLCQ